MREREPMIQRFNVRQTREGLSQLLNKVYRLETRVVVEKSGIPVAAIVSVADLERLKQLEAERSADFAAIRQVGEAFKDVEPAEQEQEVAKALAEVRDEAGGSSDATSS